MLEEAGVVLNKREQTMRLIDADALHKKISEWPESVMYKDWVQSAIANAPTIDPQPNDPLTLDELREMVDEAVYIVELHVEGKKAMIVDETAYEIVHEYGPSRLVYGYYDIGRYAVIMDVHASAYYKGEKKEGVNFWEIGVGPLIYENYGRTWLAYHRKPEE